MFPHIPRLVPSTSSSIVLAPVPSQFGAPPPRLAQQYIYQNPPELPQFPLVDQELSNPKRNRPPLYPLNRSHTRAKSPLYHFGALKSLHQMLGTSCQQTHRQDSQALLSSSTLNPINHVPSHSRQSLRPREEPPPSLSLFRFMALGLITLRRSFSRYKYGITLPPQVFF